MFVSAYPVMVQFSSHFLGEVSPMTAFIFKASGFFVCLFVLCVFSYIFLLSYLFFLLYLLAS